MWQLYQFPLCPFSRKVRLLLGEKGVGYELVRESPWARRDEFLDMNPAGQTPVMADSAAGITLIDSGAICEYFEETIEKAPMIAGTAANRAEIRRLVAWFDEKLYGQVVAPLMYERMEKRIVHRTSPDARMLREAMKAADGHLDYIDYLLDHRRWIAGAVLSLADLAMSRPAPGMPASSHGPASGLCSRSGWRLSGRRNITTRSIFRASHPSAAPRQVRCSL
jgi:glutathione S-transferase